MPDAVVLKPWRVVAAAFPASARPRPRTVPTPSSRPRRRPCRRLQPHLQMTADRNMVTTRPQSPKRAQSRSANNCFRGTGLFRKRTSRSGLEPRPPNVSFQSCRHLCVVFLPGLAFYFCGAGCWSPLPKQRESLKPLRFTPQALRLISASELGFSILVSLNNRHHQH